MTATRASRFPDLRNGTTIHHITDTHFGTTNWDAFVNDFLTRTQTDIEALKVALNGGHLHTGDMIDWWGLPSTTDISVTGPTETGWYTAWRDAITANDGLPFAEAAGNHDMLGLWDPNNGSVRVGRTAAQWATDIGLTGPNNAHDMGDLRVLTMAPDFWVTNNYADPSEAWFTLSDATLDWLDAELAADTRPTFLAAHMPLNEQTPGAQAAYPRLEEIIGGYPQVVGWLSGHYHNGITTPNWATTITVAGRSLFAVCGPGGGGGQSQAGPAYGGGQWASSSYSTFMTLLDDHTLDIRFRDHLARRWVSAGAATATHLLLYRTYQAGR